MIGAGLHEPTGDPAAFASRQPLCCIGFFIELPFDARVSPEYGSNTIGLTEPVIAGWDDFDVQRYLGFPPIDAVGVYPTTTLYFRRRKRRSEEPLRAELAAFGSEFHELLATPWYRRIWNPIRARVPLRRQGLMESRTVVLGQRIASPPEFPPPNAWIEDEFKKVPRRSQQPPLRARVGVRRYVDRPGASHGAAAGSFRLHVRLP